VSRLRTVLLALSAATAVGSFTLLVAPAGAAPADAPVSGDVRATAYAGNATTCAAAGLPGSIVEVDHTVDASNTYLTITGVPAGTTLTGVVVKGGPGYNVYVGDVRTALHAPLVSSGKPAQISHWYACGTTGTTTPTGSPTSTPTGSPTTSPTSPSGSPTTSPTTSPTSPSGSPTTSPSGSPTTSPTSPTESPSTSPAGSVTPTPTMTGETSAPPPTVPGSGPGEQPGGGLATTGSSAVPIGGLGLALLLAGIALLGTRRGRRMRHGG
jgi:hypothetical protein